MILDERAALRRLLSPEELSELCERLGPPLLASLAVEDETGERLAGAAAGVTAVTRELTCAGEPIGRVIAVGPGAEAAAAALVSAIEIAAHHAHARFLVGGTHAAAMEANYAELTAQNRRLEDAVRRLEQAERARTTFLATMSHELRTPLTAVMGFTEILLEGMAGPVSAEQRDHLRTILSKAEQLLAVIGTVLDVAHASSATARGRDRVALAALVGEVVTAHREPIERRGLRVDKALTSATIVGDARQLRQVVTHLVGNAVKFSHDGGAIELSLRVEAERAVLRVRDHGIGIPAAALPRVFEPFFQADSSSTRAHGGSGLGLTVAKTFVEAHGGTIGVAAVEGGGTEFVVELPVATSGRVERTDAR